MTFRRMTIPSPCPQASPRSCPPGPCRFFSGPLRLADYDCSGSSRDQQKELHQRNWFWFGHWLSHLNALSWRINLEPSVSQRKIGTLCAHTHPLMICSEFFSALIIKVQLKLICRINTLSIGALMFLSYLNRYTMSLCLDGEAVRGFYYFKNKTCKSWECCPGHYLSTNVY